jgi:hypothetical protein
MREGSRLQADFTASISGHDKRKRNDEWTLSI